MTIRNSSKAVSEGALWFYLDHRVRARVARHTYGSECVVTYNASNSSHRKRKDTAYTSLDGSLVVPSAFAVITRKVRYGHLTVPCIYSETLFGVRKCLVIFVNRVLR